MLTLVQLRCFAAVAAELNFRRAAKRLHMTQPPLTRHIQALEHEVGAPLLDRSRRSVRLTPAGTALARAAARILADADDAVREARQVAAGDAGSLAIAFTTAASYVYVPALIALIRERFPAIDLTLREMATPGQIAALKAQQVDLCLLRPPVSLPGVQTLRVYRETLVAAIPRDHRLGSRDRIAPADFADETFITYPPVEGPYLHGLATGVLHAAGVAPRLTLTITQTHSILALVEAGLGIALVPEAAGRFLPPGVTLRALATEAPVNVDLLLAWRADSANPASQAVLAMIREGVAGE